MLDYFKVCYFGPNLGQRKSKYGSNLWQNYLFGNNFTNYGNFELKLGQYLYFHGLNQKIQRFLQTWLFLHHLGQRRSNYGQNLGQNYIFGNIITNHCHFEMKLGHFVYFHGLNQNNQRFCQTWLFSKQFGPKKVQIWVKFGAKLHFGNCFTYQGHFEFKLGQYFQGLNQIIQRFIQSCLFLYRISAKQGLNTVQICGKITFLAIASPIRVILS